ncbi:GFA family protein [Sandarakinorhabdus sp.]|uniref:GFA family protein n=1 Tax=Sandarakinorhabdus sp. TaxID=1916663 RepID=UPI0033415508
MRFVDPPELLDCNCSICAKTGYLHLIAGPADFTLLNGADVLTDYRWGTGTARHLFCARCGIKSFYVPLSHPNDISVNWRALDDVGDIVPRIVAFDGISPGKTTEQRMGSS